MKKCCLIILYLAFGIASAQELPVSAFQAKEMGFRGAKNIWLGVTVTDNMNGRDLTSTDMWKLAAKALEKEGFVVAKQNETGDSYHYPAVTIVLNRLGSIRCGFGWYATYTAETYFQSAVKLPSGKYVKWMLYDDDTYGYSLADQASDKLLEFQNSSIKAIGELYRKAN